MAITQPQTDEQLATVEEQEVEYWKNQFAALERLYENEDFKTVILEGYFKDQAVRSVSLLATDYLKSIGKRGDVFENLVAISALEAHLSLIESLGNRPDEDEEE